MAFQQRKQNKWLIYLTNLIDPPWVDARRRAAWRIALHFASQIEHRRPRDGAPTPRYQSAGSATGNAKLTVTPTRALGSIQMR
ncbi:MAG: hypothetical protein KAG72_12130, partial [Abyssibacter sp.]